MEFNTKLSKLIARRKVIETRKRLNKIVQSPFEINNTLKIVYMIKLKLTLLLILYFIMIVKIKLKFQYRL